jgi:hypothetical protein
MSPEWAGVASSVGRVSRVALVLAASALVVPTGCGSGGGAATSTVGQARTYSVSLVEAAFERSGLSLTAHPGGFAILRPYSALFSWTEQDDAVMTTANGEIKPFTRFVTVIVFRNADAARSALGRPRVKDALLPYLRWTLRSNVLLIDNSLRAPLWKKAQRALDSAS